MGEVSFADGFDAPDRIAFGLAAPQLAVAAAGTVSVYLIAQSSLPMLLRAPVAVLVLASAAVLAWGRFDQRPALTWAVLMARFAVRPHAGVLVVASGEGGGDQPTDEATTAAASDPDECLEPDEPEWARWLRTGRSATDAGAPSTYPTAEDGAADPETGGLAVEESAPAAILPDAIPHETSQPQHPGGTDDELVDHVVEIHRTPLVLLPSPPAGDHDGSDGADDELPADDLELPDESTMPELPMPAHHHWRGEIPAQPPAVVPDTGPPTPFPPRNASPGNAPVFVGATRRVTFFSLNGGAGRTTLATEVACLLAANGRHRTGPNDPPRRLRVALLDLDLRSATVSVHLGIPQPTVWDYMVGGGDDPARIDDFMVSHPSGLRALLGPPKPLSTDGATLEPARVAEIVHQLERDGTHFIIIDISGDLNAVTTWVLSAVHDIYVVLTPTASGVQDAYRTTESLRRIGLASKLRYVVNRARGPVDLRETMNDLGGEIVATIPYDACIEDAENHHQIAALERTGPAVAGIHALAAHIYPGLGLAGRESLLSRLRWWRRAG